MKRRIMKPGLFEFMEDDKIIPYRNSIGSAGLEFWSKIIAEMFKIFSKIEGYNNLYINHGTKRHYLILNERVINLLEHNGELAHDLINGMEGEEIEIGIFKNVKVIR